MVGVMIHGGGDAGASFPLSDITDFERALGVATGFEFAPTYYPDPSLTVAGQVLNIPDRAATGKARTVCLTLARTPPKIASDPAANGQTMLDLTGIPDGADADTAPDAPDMIMNGSVVTPSVSFVVACTRPPVANGGMLISGSGAAPSFPHKLRTSATGDLYFDPMGQSALADTNVILSANMPAVASTMILAGSYDNPSKTSVVFVNSVVGQSKVHINGFPEMAVQRWVFGGPGPAATTLGWRGKMGRALIWSQALHTTTKGQRALANAITLMKTTYGVA